MLFIEMVLHAVHWRYVAQMAYMRTLNNERRTLFLALDLPILPQFKVIHERNNRIKTKHTEMIKH